MYERYFFGRLRFPVETPFRAQLEGRTPSRPAGEVSAANVGEDVAHDLWTDTPAVTARTSPTIRTNNKHRAAKYPRFGGRRCRGSTEIREENDKNDGRECACGFTSKSRRVPSKLATVRPIVRTNILVAARHARRSFTEEDVYHGTSKPRKRRPPPNNAAAAALFAPRRTYSARGTVPRIGTPSPRVYRFGSGGSRALVSPRSSGRHVRKTTSRHAAARLDATAAPPPELHGRGLRCVQDALASVFRVPGRNRSVLQVVSQPPRYRLLTVGRCHFVLLVFVYVYVRCEVFYYFSRNRWRFRFCRIFSAPLKDLDVFSPFVKTTSFGYRSWLLGTQYCYYCMFKLVCCNSNNNSVCIFFRLRLTISQIQ